MASKGAPLTVKGAVDGSAHVNGKARPRSLSILPNQAYLRATEKDKSPKPFLSPLDAPSSSEDEGAPRALRGLARIIDGGLCHRCGSCIGICPTSVLSLDEEDYPQVTNLSACTDCDLCVKVCPGDEFTFQETHQEIFGAPGNLEDTHGLFLEGSISHSTDDFIREHSTSGGLVTALLCHMLESGQIDGALIVGSDPKVPWKGRPFIARSRQDLLSGMKSKYAISPTNVSFAEVRETPGRYAMVGLPCQIHGYHKAIKLDERLKERIVLAVGLFCHAAIEHEAFRVIWETLGDKAHRVRRFISRVGKHPGTPYVELDDGSMYPVYFGNKSGYRPTSMEVLNILYRLYTPVRCTTCFDGLADFADISVGDPWMAPPEDHVDFYRGWSLGLIRTERGRRAYDSLLNSRQIESLPVTKREVSASNRMMATEKRWRAFRVIETHRRQGKPIPTYGAHNMRFPRHKGRQFVETEMHMLSHIFCFLPRWRAAALRFFLGSGGYYLLWLNSLRRGLRTGLRDFKAQVMRGIFGRR